MHLFHIATSSPYYPLGNVVAAGESAVNKGEITHVNCLADSRNLINVCNHMLQIITADQLLPFNQTWL